MCVCVCVCVCVFASVDNIAEAIRRLFFIRSVYREHDFENFKEEALTV